MTRGVPMLNPNLHLKGATPEKLARALLRNPIRPRSGVQSVAGNEISKKQVATDKAGNRVPQLAKRV